MSTKRKSTLVKNKIAKVPVVIQMEALECGAASLTMILGYFGKWLPLEQVRKDCGVSRDGSSAKNILIAARYYGLEAFGYRYELDELIKNGSFPCIIHWNFNHFVVLCGFKKNRAVLCDPARGQVEVPLEEFDRSFTGITLVMQPTDAFEPSGNKKNMASFAAERLRGSGSVFLMVIITTVILSLLGLVTPVMTKIFTDRLLSGTNPGWAVPFLCVMALFTFLQIVVAWIQTVSTMKANSKIAIVSGSKFMWHVLRMPVEFFSQRMTGDIAIRLMENETITSSLIQTVAPMTIQIAMMSVYGIIMLRYNVALALLSVGLMVVSILVNMYVTRKKVDLMRVSSRNASLKDSFAFNGIDMIESIKAAGAENGYFEKWAGYAANSSHIAAQTVDIDVKLGLIPMIISQLATILVLMGSAYLVIRGHWTVGMIAAFSGFLQSFMQPVSAFIGSTEMLLNLQNSIERVDDVINYPSDVSDERVMVDSKEEYVKLSGEVELKNITFGYSPLGAPLIENFSMHIMPGKRVALVGASGSGKSTMSKLISGLYKPWSGEILIDGKPISDISREVFTSCVSVVDQDITLFEDTIANNIKMWDETIEDFEMILAARDAMIHDDIMVRPGGYDYKLIEGGKDLSGGQKQRLEIARVLAQDPTIVILDEATSALDAKTEYRVINAIKDRGITCVVIAHRLSTIRDCDEIIVLDRGKVVERGTHDELMALNGTYCNLVVNE